MKHIIQIISRRSVAVVLLLLTTIAGFAQEIDEVPEDSIFTISSDTDSLMIEDHVTDSLFADSLQKRSLMPARRRLFTV